LDKIKKNALKINLYKKNAEYLKLIAKKVLFSLFAAEITPSPLKIFISPGK